MARTVKELTPGDAAYDISGNYPVYQKINNREVLSFDKTANRSCIWSGKAPQNLTGNMQLIVDYFIGGTVTTGDLDLDAEIEAINSGDAINLNSASSFDSVNSSDNNSVPGSAGNPGRITITLTNKDGLVAGEDYRVRLTRDQASDTCTGTMHVFMVELQDSV